MNAKPRAIRIDRRWIGAPDGAFNPTVALFAVAVGGFALGGFAIGVGRLPVAVGVLWQAVCLYLSFTVLHDAMHGTAHRSKWLGNAMGRVCGLLLLTPLPLFRGVHHAHHGHTNDPDQDPDLFVARGPAWLRPITLWLGLPSYRWHFYRHRLWRDTASFRESITCDIVLVVSLAALIIAGYGDLLLAIWLGPAAIAVGWLAFAFDYLPHRPHTEQRRYFDTRVCPGRFSNAVFLGQNYHLIHHLWTTIPWYRYREVFVSIEPELRDRGCAIGWRSAAVAPGSGPAVEGATGSTLDSRRSATA